ncbi:MAG: sensor domain-containing protein [Steroidobacteraceae bacterium]
MRVVFPYLAQLHQVFHSLPIAAQMAMTYPQVRVHAAGATSEHVDFICKLLERFAPRARVFVDRFDALTLRTVNYGKKSRLLFRNRNYLRSFDAIVTPERSSLVLRRVGLGETKLIWTRHGAGDRAIGFADDIHQFDYVLMAGRKIEARLLASGQIRPGQYATGVYSKFDWLASAPSPRLFENAAPVVLYNPHFEAKLSSWPLMGHAILEFFAAHPQWNLVFAPHVRLFDPPTADKYREFERYGVVSNIVVDLGSERSIDMTYLTAADFYLGDVSSQVAEFICRPRPCLFLNTHGAEWRNDANYRSWTLGSVVDTLDDFERTLERAFATHGEFIKAQHEYITDTFDLPPGSSSAARGAQAIVSYLESTADTARSSARVLGSKAQPRPQHGTTAARL